MIIPFFSGSFMCFLNGLKARCMIMDIQKRLTQKDEMRGKNKRATGVDTLVNEDCERVFNKADRFLRKSGRNKTKLLIWCWGRQGAAPIFTYTMLKQLSQYDNIELFVSISKQSDYYKQIKNLNLKGFYINTYTDKFSFIKSLFRVPKLRKQFKQFLIENNIDTILCPFTHLWNNFFCSIINKLKKRYIFFVHDAISHSGENYLIRNKILLNEIKHADKIIALSSSVKNTIEKITKNKSDCELLFLPPFEYSENNTPRTLLNKKEIVLLFFGRILPYKDLNLLLDAIIQLQGKYSNIKLLLAGQGNLQPYLSKLEQIKSKQIINRWISENEIHDIFIQTDIVVLPYLEATQSGVTPISMTYGIPAIATPVGGLIEQIKNKVTGLITNDISSNSIAFSIESLLTHPNLYAELSKNLLCESKNEQSWEKFTLELLKVLTEN